VSEPAKGSVTAITVCGFLPGPPKHTLRADQTNHWIDFAEIWVVIWVASTNFSANYSMISMVK
jgi:hypothetical protein